MSATEEIRRNALSEVSAKQGRKIPTTGCVGWDYRSTFSSRSDTGKLAEVKHDFRGLWGSVKQIENNIFSQHAVSATSCIKFLKTVD